MKTRAPNGKFLVKISCVTGILALVVFAVILAIAALRSPSGLFGRENQYDSIPFAEKLRKFDEFYAVLNRSGKEPSITLFAPLLASLERQAIGTEGHLAVLKRRRFLTKILPSSTPEYTAAVEKAAEQFPRNALIAALAGEALILGSSGSPALADKTDERLYGYALTLSETGPFTETSFNPLALMFYGYSGALRNAAEAAKIPRADELFTGILKDQNSPLFVPLSIDAAILQILQNEYAKSDSFVLPLNMMEHKTAMERDFLANYAYDFGDPILAARLWTDSAQDRDLARAADALYLARLYENALQLWQLLSNRQVDARLRRQALYNRANIQPQTAGRIAALEQLLSESAGLYTGAPAMYGLILYSRVSNTRQTESLLNEAAAQTGSALFDLELFRRRVRKIPIDQAIAETWLLSGRYPDDPRLYAWSAWFFNFHRRYQETAFLINIAEKRHISGIWLPFNRALTEITCGNYREAFNSFDTAVQSAIDDGETPGDELWAVYADRALIQESRREFTAALAGFQAALNRLSLTGSEFSLDANSRNRNAARLELKLAHCFTILGRKEEARKAVINAASLDGDNINVRVAVENLDR